MDIIIAILKWCFEHWIITSLVLLFLIGRIASAVIEKRLEEEREEERRAREEEKRRRFFTCDECGKEEALVKGRVEEIDRYPTYKELRETTSSGKTKTRQVKIFKVTEKRIIGVNFAMLDLQPLIQES
ncbi:hypothetical protein M2R47_03710 [Moraxella sp. Tifton1]|uniref:hypothetical protein n=1 Tax=Moraxella oculi TaxID=2940516 RepID=UPI0020130BE4|nr:hypothetical protein [Moraxella sp. Tifton1]MCL1623361.1 hypothetical protein [Moraxella sp. Tifton1]